MKIRSKLANIFWLIYLALSVCFIIWDFLFVSDKPSMLDNMVGLAISILSLAGLVGFIFQRRIGYRLLWRILFCLAALGFGFGLAVILFVGELPNSLKFLAILAIAIPSYYALFSYAYRSPHIWEKS
jgi:hypothetical protein